MYTDLYSSVPYLYKFDKYILDSIENSTGNSFNSEVGTFQFGDVKYSINDVESVLNKKHLSNTAIKKIDSKNILI